MAFGSSFLSFFRHILFFPTMTNKALADQMAALANNLDDSTSFADRSNSLLNVTCPARIQNTSSDRAAMNSSLVELGESRRAPLSRRMKREPLRITPLAQIDEVPPVHRRSTSRHSESYKTKLCDAFRRQGHCPYNNDCPYAHGTDELRMPPRRKPFVRNNIEPARYRRDSGDDSRDRIPPQRHQNRGYYPPSRQICKNFERGACRYGPRCKYIHREQMPYFDQNASVYLPSEPQVSYYQNGPCFVAQPYFYPPQQYARPDLNQTMPVFSTGPMNMNSSFYYQPMAPTPVMDQVQSTTPPQPLLMMPDLPPPESLYGPPPIELIEEFPNGFFQRPPPPIILNNAN